MVDTVQSAAGLLFVEIMFSLRQKEFVILKGDIFADSPLPTSQNLIFLLLDIYLDKYAV